MKHGYDNASFFYDRLCQLVFGNKLQLAQTCLLPAIMPADHILIVGGGSGWIIEAISKLHPSGLTMTYVDASPKMIALAKEKNKENNKINFIAAPIEEVKLSSDYDVVITPFFFDNFLPAQAATIFTQLNNTLRGNGCWLLTDFQNTGKVSYQLVLKSMYLFFGILCGVKASQLPDMNKHFEQYSYTLTKEQFFINGFVASRAYKKCG